MPQSAIARTPLWDWHTSHGARMTAQLGWDLPAVYSSVEQEAAAARSGVALADLSSFAKLALLGPSASAAAEALAGPANGCLPRRAWRCGPAASGEGSQVLACRLHDEHLLLLAGGPAREPLLQCAASLRADGLEQVDVTMAYCSMALAGPNIAAVLRQLTSLTMSAESLPEGRCAETKLAGVHAILVRPAQSAPRLVYILAAWDLGQYVWERLLAAGKGWDIVPMGLEAWHTAILAGGNAPR